MRLLAPKTVLAVMLCAWCCDAFPGDKVRRAKREDGAGRKPEQRSALWKEFRNYRTWKRTTDEPFFVPAQDASMCAPARAVSSPHADAFVSIYVNSLGRDAYLADEPIEFVEGTVIVKEKLPTKHATKPAELGIMIKRKPGFDPDAGDWQYLFLDKDQKLTASRAKLANCIDCHSRRADTGYVFRRTGDGTGNQSGYESDY